MKMAKASERDLEAANAVARIIGELEKDYMPSGDEDDGIEFFDRNDAEQCQRALSAILDAADKGCVFRVTFGMLVVLDPRNRIVDPDTDTLELHPDHVANATDGERYRWWREYYFNDDFRPEFVPGSAETPEQLDAGIDAARAKGGV